jgi:hypothetical protein
VPVLISQFSIALTRLHLRSGAPHIVFPAISGSSALAQLKSIHLLPDDNAVVDVGDLVALLCLTKLNTLAIRGGRVAHADAEEHEDDDNILVQLLTPLGESLSELELWLWLPRVNRPLSCIGRCCP